MRLYIDTLVGGGGGGIRTRDTVSRIHTFQACAFSRSATPPRTARISPGQRRAQALQDCASASASSRARILGSRGKPARIQFACNVFSASPTPRPGAIPRARRSAPENGKRGGGVSARKR